MEMMKFRSQFGGFHRVDVANYIEKIAAEHQQAINEMKDEWVTMAAQRDAARAELETVKAQLEALLEGKELPQPQIPEGDPEQLELEAYRRAEAAERSAMARVRRQTEKMDAILDGAGAQFEDAKAEVEAIRTQLSTVLDGLQSRFAGITADMQQLKKETEE